MKIELEQVYGSQEAIDLQLVKPKLILEDTKECEALANGWAIYHRNWYLSRLTRIKVSEYNLPKPIKNYEITKVFGALDPEYLEQVEKVYNAFIVKKGFTPLYDFYADMERSSWILVSKDNTVRAFTKFHQYDGALESNLTAWDYSEPNASIGRKLIEYEVDIARNFNYDYLYIGPGYNKSSLYKADLKGFEWWTGTDWSADKNKYKELCLRDDTITTLKELSNLYAN